MNESAFIVAALTADTNLDGTVDGVDLQNWLAHAPVVPAGVPAAEGTQVPDAMPAAGTGAGLVSAATGDFNFDGVVDGRDFDLWYTAAGAGAQPTLESLGLDRATLSGLRAAPVPEPGTMAALGAGALALLRRKKRGRPG